MREPVADSPQLTAALRLAETWGARIAVAHGMYAGKCTCGRDGCASPAKHPIGERWHELASSDADMLRAVILPNPQCNIGIATGSGSGLVVLDVDGEEGERTLAAWVATHGPLPATVEVKTPRGRHLYFRAPAGIVLHNRAGARGRGLGAGLDLRAENGFVICPPSVNVDGIPYVWVRGPADAEPAACPDWIVERAREQPTAAPPETRASRTGDSASFESRSARWAHAALEREAVAVGTAKPGQRNHQLNESAFNLAMIVAGGQLDAGEVKRTLLTAALACGLSELEAQKTLRSGFTAGLKKDVRTGPTNGWSAGDSGVFARPSEQRPKEEPSPFEPRYRTDQIFGPLPAQRWAVPDLQIGPGRPTLFVGYGGSAKTLAAQSLALALAAGRPVWERYESAPQSVLHLDFEQGFYATAKRYQRLAVGHGIDPRELGARITYVELPRVYLDKPGAVDAYLRACEGYDLVVIDSLRGAAPFGDENDSSFRGAVDVLTYVSQRGGSSFLVLHHAGKPRAEKGQAPPDGRTLARGSGAIFDAAGAVFNFAPGEGGARLVRQVKTPAEATGTSLDQFELAIEDVSGTEGVRVLWRKPVPVDEAAKAAAKYERDAALVLAAVERRTGGGTANEVLARCGLARGRALDVARALADEGRLELVSGPSGRAKVYRIPPNGGVRP